MCQVRACGPLVQNCLYIYINMQYTKRWMNIKKCFAEKTVPSYPLYLWKRNQFSFCWISTGCAMSCSRGCIMSCSQCRVIQDAAFFLPQISLWMDTSPAGFQPAQTEKICSLCHILHPVNCKLTFCQVNTLFSKLDITRPHSTSKVGTYAVPCASCNKILWDTGASLLKYFS